MTQSDLYDNQDSGCIDYTDAETLRRLYWEKGLSTREIAEMTEVTSGGVQSQMDKHGIETRSLSESKRQNHAGFRTSVNGYERWRDTTFEEWMKVHRLVAVAEYGFEAVADKHVHHENSIPWDNRPENLTPLTPAEHINEHHAGGRSENAKLTEPEARQIKRLAQKGNRTHQEIADQFGVERSLVTMIKNGRRWASLE